jgi:hypothetical protein
MVATTGEIGRNDPCPCGSGKKFKNCHLGMRNPPFRRSPQYFTLKGKKAEQLIQELAEKTFLKDWCYPNPRLPDGKELCDLLVVFDRTVIIWQIKDLKPDKTGCIKTSDLEKNLRQLAGARRQLFELRSNVELSNPRRGIEHLDASSITDVYLISVILSRDENVAVQQISFVENVKGHPAHVFFRQFTQLVLNELDTISDFCEYLRALESVTKDSSIILLSGQEELLAHYLIKGKSFIWMKREEITLIHEGAWSALKASEAYRRKKEEDSISYLWDQLIDSAHEGAGEEPRYERVARELARSNRSERSLLAHHFLEAHELAHNDLHNNIFRRVMSFQNITYCFVFMHNPLSEKVRTKLLEKTCFVARGRYRDNPRVIGIATGTKMNLEHRFHFGMMDISAWNDEHQKEMEKLQAEFGILTRGTEVVRDIEFKI